MHRSLVDFASGSSDVYDTPHFLSFLYPAQCARRHFRVNESPSEQSRILEDEAKADRHPIGVNFTGPD